MWFSPSTKMRERKRRKFHSQQDDFPVNDENYERVCAFHSLNQTHLSENSARESDEATHIELFTH